MLSFELLAATSSLTLSLPSYLLPREGFVFLAGKTLLQEVTWGRFRNGFGKNDSDN